MNFSGTYFFYSSNKIKKKKLPTMIARENSLQPAQK